MNTKHIISAVAFAALILPALSFAQEAGSAGSGSSLKAGTRMGVVSTTTREVRKVERMAERATRIKERIGHLLDKADERVAKMTENQNRIDVILTRFADRGVDVTDSRTELAKGRAILTEVTSAIIAARTELSTITLDGTSKDAAKAMRNEIDVIHSKIKNAHEATMNSIRNLRARVGESKEKPENNSTTTSTTTQ